MIFEFDSMDAYNAALKGNPGLNGTAPINAADTLGISRQSVQTAIKRGELDAVKIQEARGRPLVFVTRESMARYSLTPARGRPPKVLPEGENAKRWSHYKANRGGD